MILNFQENGLYLDLEVTDEGDVRLLNFSDRKRTVQGNSQWFRLVELQESGCNKNDNCGSKNTGTQPGSLLRYVSHTREYNPQGMKLTVRQHWNGLDVASHFQFYTGIRAVRSWTEMENKGMDEIHPVEYVSSFVLTGLGRGGMDFRDNRNRIGIPHNTWFGEVQWRFYDLEELGYGTFCGDEGADFSMKRIGLVSTGTWAAGEHLPMGSFTNFHDRRTMTWQIETSGSWNWEVSDVHGDLYLAVSGPSGQENGFFLNLKPGERFATVPCAVSWGRDFQETIRELTRYRRMIRRPNGDNRNPSVIFNDYMNCLWGDPTTEKEYPLIDAAAEAGCRYYCVDCGWYSDGPWWDGVGEWLPSRERFPGGIGEVLNYIRSRGMIPGLWLELEVMGIKCPLVSRVPREWFFQRNGQPVIYRSRYQLDFRNGEVRAFADGVIDRLVGEYGAGYIKMDYNINAGVGTDYLAESAGRGLLDHNRAYLEWLDGVLLRYPELVIENCGSGGMRMEYSLLSRLSIQSVTDQTDYRKMAAIACNCPTAVTPEQAAIWSYPLKEGDEEEAIFNMVNALLLRIHQSGHLPRLSPERQALVREGIRCHLDICHDLKEGLPFWPLGLGSMTSPFLALGLDCGKILYLAVWHVHGEDETIEIPLEGYAVREAECLYPRERPVPLGLTGGILRLSLKHASARLFRLILE